MYNKYHHTVERVFSFLLFFGKPATIAPCYQILIGRPVYDPISRTGIRIITIHHTHTTAIYVHTSTTPLLHHPEVLCNILSVYIFISDMSISYPPISFKSTLPFLRVCTARVIYHSNPRSVSFTKLHYRHSFPYFCQGTRSYITATSVSTIHYPIRVSFTRVPTVEGW